MSTKTLKKNEICGFVLRPQMSTKNFHFPTAGSKIKNCHKLKCDLLKPIRGKIEIKIKSCEFSENIYINEDGSGTMEFKFDGSTLMELAGDEIADEGEEKIDTTINFTQADIVEDNLSFQMVVFCLFSVWFFLSKNTFFPSVVAVLWDI